MRIADQVERGAPLTIFVDGVATPGFLGETVATVMIASEQRVFRIDKDGLPRGLYCNMGTCCECMVQVGEGDRAMALRACLLPAVDGLRISTGYKEP